MYLRGNYWHYDFCIGKVRYRGTTGFIKSEKSKAKQCIERMKVELRDKHSLELIWKQTRKRMMKFCDIPLNSQEIWHTFSTANVQRSGLHRRKLCRSRIESFCSFMSAEYPSVITVSEVDALHANSYRLLLENSRMSNSTRNDHISALKMVFGYLQKNGNIVLSPFEKIKKFSTEKVKREIFTSRELELIFANASGWLYSLFITALFTGLREGDIALLEKKSIDGSCSWITINRIRKTGKRADIPVHSDLRGHLQEQLSVANDSQYVFPELAEIYLTSPKRIGREVKKFFRQIGICGTGVEVSGYKNRVSVKDVHSFRHTFIYRAALNNIPLPVIQSIAGHTSSEMTKYYMDHATREEKAAQLKKLMLYDIKS